MSQAATREDIDEVLDLLHIFMKQVDDRFNEQEKKYDKLITTIDGFISRIDKYEIELAARDAQLRDWLNGPEKSLQRPGYL